MLTLILQKVCRERGGIILILIMSHRDYKVIYLKNRPKSPNFTAGLTANEELSVINLDKKSITKCELILSAKINLCIPVRLHIKITGEMIY